MNPKLKPFESRLDPWCWVHLVALFQAEYARGYSAGRKSGYSEHAHDFDYRMPGYGEMGQ